MISLPILLTSLGCAMAVELTCLHQWKYLDYEWKNESEREGAIATGLYNPNNTLLYDAGWHKEQDSQGPGLMQPYPSPEWHVAGNCSVITNAVKFACDECDNMWIVDSGVIGHKMICPAKIVKFDLKTDQPVMQYEIPDEVTKGGLLVIAAVRTEGPNCDNILVVATDQWGSGFVFFDGNSSWRYDNNIFEPDTNFTLFKVHDHLVNITLGPIGFVFLDKKYADTEFGIMWSGSAVRAYGMPIPDLIRSRDSQDNLTLYKAEYEFPSPTLSGVVSKQGTLFGSFFQGNKIQCVWLRNPILTGQVNALIHESEFPLEIGSIKIITYADGEEYLLIAATNYLAWRAGMTDSHEVKLGIYVVKTADIVNNTGCQPRADFVPAKSWAGRGFIPV